jgi:hypothetical protein
MYVVHTLAIRVLYCCNTDRRPDSQEEDEERKVNIEKNRFRIRDVGGQWHIFSLVTEKIRKKLLPIP